MSNTTTYMCGECSACCLVYDIPELDKKQGEWCRHCPTHSGCAIHDQPRPEACEKYACLWVKEGVGKRPSEQGVIFEKEIIEADGIQISVIYFAEVWPGALQSLEMQKLAAHFRKELKMVVCYRRLLPSGGYASMDYLISKGVLSQAALGLFTRAINEGRLKELVVS